MHLDNIVLIRITDGAVLLREQISPTVSRSLITFTFYPTTTNTNPNNLYESPLILVPSIYRPIKTIVASFQEGSFNTFMLDAGFWVVMGIGPEDATQSDQIQWCAITPRNYSRVDYLYRPRQTYGFPSTPTGNPPTPALQSALGVQPYEYRLPHLKPKPDEAWFFRVVRRGSLSNWKDVVYAHFIVEERINAS